MKIIHTSGKRKTAVARATLKEGKGMIKINNRLLNIFQPEMARMRIQEPLMLAGNTVDKVDISVDVNGGGFNSQAEAVRLSIAKALAQFQPNLKKTFLDYDRHLLVSDIRRKESYKPNDSKARSKRQKSYR